MLGYIPGSPFFGGKGGRDRGGTVLLIGKPRPHSIENQSGRVETADKDSGADPKTPTATTFT